MINIKTAAVIFYILTVIVCIFLLFVNPLLSIGVGAIGCLIIAPLLYTLGEIVSKISSIDSKLGTKKESTNPEEKVISEELQENEEN